MRFLYLITILIAACLGFTAALGLASTQSLAILFSSTPSSNSVNALAFGATGGDCLAYGSTCLAYR